MKTKKMDEKRSQSHLERITKINVKINSCATKVSLMEQKSAKFWVKIYSPIKKNDENCHFQVLVFLEREKDFFVVIAEFFVL